MFSLLRPDVFPLDDLGLQSALSRHYFDGAEVAADVHARARRALAPWRSVATWYLWRCSIPHRWSTEYGVPTAGRDRGLESPPHHETTFLEFEQPIAELEARIEELRFVQDDSAVDISEEIQRLQKRSQALTKEIYAKLSPWQVAQVARHPQRPYTLDYLQRALHRFRGAARRPRVRRRSVDRGRARALQRPAGAWSSATRRDATPRRRSAAQLRHAQPEGYRKALRLMKLAEKFGLPVITFVDTPGRLSGNRRRGARPVRGDRPQPVRDGRAEGADRRARSSARAARAARSRSRSATSS